MSEDCFNKGLNQNLFLFSKKKTYSDKHSPLNRFSDLINKSNTFWENNIPTEIYPSSINNNTNKYSELSEIGDSLKEEDFDSSISPKKHHFKVIHESPIQRKQMFQFKKPSKSSLELNKRGSQLRSSWSKEEDELLLYLRNNQKISTWVDISTYFLNKNPKQCSYRFKKILNLNNKQKIYWSKEEEEKLQSLTELYGDNIDALKGYFNNKSLFDIKQKLLSINHFNMTTTTPEQDRIIIEYYKNGTLPDDKISKIKHLNINQLRKRLDFLLKISGEKVTESFSFSKIELQLSKDSSQNSIYLSNTNTYSQVSKEKENNDLLLSKHESPITINQYNFENNINSMKDESDYNDLKSKFIPIEPKNYFDNITSYFNNLSVINENSPKKIDEPILKLRRLTSDNNLIANYYNQLKENDIEHQSLEEIFNERVDNEFMDFNINQKYFNEENDRNLFDKKVLLEKKFKQIYEATHQLYDNIDTIINESNLSIDDKSNVRNRFDECIKEELKLIESEQTELIESIERLIKLIKINQEKFLIIKNL